MPAAKLKSGPAGSVGALPRKSARYERDFYSWTLEQSAALRGGRLAELDLANLAEEVEDLGKEQLSKLESALRLILLHLSKWDRQPERRSRSRALTVERERKRFERLRRANPGLKSRQEEALDSAYADARLEAMDETGLPRAAFPEACPYTLEEALTRPIEWPEP